MLRPDRMSKVSVAGAKPYLKEVVEELHDLNLVHVSDYDGRWEGFDNGTPMEGGEEVSERLVQVRAIESKLDLEPGEFPELSDERYSFTGDRTEELERLEEVRSEVNDLDDQRVELKDRMRELRERQRTLEPFVELDIELDLLRGYESVELRVGTTGDREGVLEALEEASSIQEHDVIGDEVVAVVARTSDGGLGDALAGVDFTELEVPDEKGHPGDLHQELEHEIQDVEDDLDSVEDDLEDIKQRHGAFLLALEEELSIEAQKSEIPLQFATTENSFYAEGWIPTEEVQDLNGALGRAVGDHVEVQELEVAEYDEHGHAVEHGDEEDDEDHEDFEDPPVKQDNPEVAQPFELLVNTVNRPKYTELDPTFVVFLTFPFAFGFMIGDMGYGVLYMLMGAAIYRFVDSDAMKALGVIAIWAGIFTLLFGYLYDDIFGIHLADVGIHLPLAGSFSKGIQAADVAQTWLVASVLFGILHLNTAYVFGIVNHVRHSVKHAVLEYASWMLAINGFFIWVFSRHVAEPKPDFIMGETSVLYENSMFALGFPGFSPEVGVAGLVVAALGAAMVVAGEGIVGALELPANAFGHVLSYLRIMAVLLAKGGMAFVVNLLVFGAYEDNGYIQFGLHESPAATVAAGGADSVAFGGIVWMGVEAGGALLAVAAVAAVLVFVLGHILVLLLGITAAGIQMVRLEYVEFFGKFYEGGGRPFQPFGRQREYTEDGN